MTSKLPRKYYLIPILYLLLIGGFLHLHLDEIGGRYITNTVGPVTIRYRQDNGVRKNVSRLNIYIGSLAADLSDGVPVEDQGGRTDLIGIRQVEFQDDVLKIILAGGGSIHFFNSVSLSGGVQTVGPSTASRSSSFGIMYEESENNAESIYPVLRFSIPETAVIEEMSPFIPLLSMNIANQSYLVAHNHNIETDQQSMTIRFNRKGMPGLFSAVQEKSAEDQEKRSTLLPGIVAETVPSDDKLSYWFFGNRKPIDSRFIKEAVKEKVDNMLRFWEGENISDSGKMMTAYTAQLLQQTGRFPSERLVSGFNAAQASADWIAAPLFGNIVEAEQKYLQRERETLRMLDGIKLNALYDLLADSIKSTGYPSILAQLIFADEDGIARRYETDFSVLLESFIKNSISAAGLFELLVEGAALYPDRFADFDMLLNPSYEQILANTVSTGSQLVYRAYSDDESETQPVLAVNPFVQLRVAQALLRYADLKDEPFAQAIGNSLLLSVLETIDSQGSIPAEIIFQQATMQTTGSRLRADDFYPFLVQNTYYPRVVSLQKELGTNVRVWTSARGVGAVRRQDGYEITFDFSPQETEYVVLRGIEPFSEIEMYGLTWNGDWRFQNYDVGGWFYDRERKVLYMKIQHKEKIERIRFINS